LTDDFVGRSDKNWDGALDKQVLDYVPLDTGSFDFPFMAQKSDLATRKDAEGVFREQEHTCGVRNKHLALALSEMTKFHNFDVGQMIRIIRPCPHAGDVVIE